MKNRLLSLVGSESYMLFGARGTGKSTLIQAELGKLENKRVIWIDLLKAKEEQRYLNSPDLLSAQIKQHRSELDWVVIDEVQKIPKLLDVVHNEIELSRKLGSSLKFALSGSSARKLKRSGSNLLAGRAIVHHLFPFTSQELGSDFNIKNATYYGTIPGILHYTTNSTRQAALESYVTTYLSEEIVAEQILRNVQPFRKFLNLSAQANGTLINFHKMGTDIGVDDKTVKTYYDILEDTLLGFYLPAYDKSLRKQQLKSPKFYLFDCGVKRILDPNLPEEAPLSSQEFGLAFEHFIICEFFRLRSYYRKKMSFSHYNTGNSEIDLIIEMPRFADAFIEIKASEEIKDEHLKTLKLLKNTFPTLRYFCLSQDPISRVEDEIQILHWQEGLKMFFQPT